MRLLFNSLNHKLEHIPDEVSIYLCGITAYDIPHLGNSRGRIILDVLIRLLQYDQVKYQYISNVTDIDDKIIQRAQELNILAPILVANSVKVYEEYLQLLGCMVKPQIPYATDTIPEILDLISILIKQEVAYSTIDGHVYFRVPKVLPAFYPKTRMSSHCIYGKLKENPEDFVLWKPSKENEPFWESLYSKGRPGWHTECAAMILKYAPNLTIHAGGCDLKFPHHANELLQLKQMNCIPKIWMHINMLSLNNIKMSKSEGNSLKLNEIMQILPPIIIRLIMLSTHYQHSLEWSRDKINQAISFYRKLKKRRQKAIHEKACNGVLNALRNNLNTPEALRQLLLSPDDELLSGMNLLGLNDCAEINTNIKLDDVQRLFNQYQNYKKKLDYKNSDKIREELQTMGISVQGKFWIQDLISF